MEKYSNINFQEGRAFLAMYEHKNSKQAGDEVGMISSMINLYINRFEKKLGKKLFLRNRRTGTFLPTESSHEIAKYVRNMLFYADLVYSDHKSNEQKVTISSTILFLEFFIAPYFREFVRHNKEILIGINQNDDLSFENPGFNEILLTASIEDNSTYEYIPYHFFEQKLWASPEYVKGWGKLEKIEDLKDHWLLLRKYLDNPATILGSSYANAYLNKHKGNFRAYEMRSPRIAYYLCENGL
jgi:DNA-binding transcriptional LysR family regulator